MRLWHVDLIPLLPRDQGSGQHRELCGMRGLGWGRKHSTVNYVYDHSYIVLFRYHEKVIEELESRGYNIDQRWKDPKFRGKNIGYVEFDDLPNISLAPWGRYPEHNPAYYQECIDNLSAKGIEIEEAV